MAQEFLLSFFSGVGVSLVGALVANVFTKNRERRRVVDERRFEIYMKLMDLHSSYFWVTASEVQGKPVSDETRQRCHHLAWQIADMLRSADEVDCLEQILEVILAPTFKSATDRYEAMGRVIDELGRRVNPKYSKKIREISDANMKLMASGDSSNAPGASSPL